MADFVSQILSVRGETPDVKTFRLTKPQNFSFIPGQYCLVSFASKTDFGDETRPFTFSNSPTDSHIELTVKRMGKFTTALYSLAPGDRLNIFGPDGESLNFDDSIHDDIVLLAGGSGITPFMSILRYAVAKKLRNNFTLLFGSKSDSDIIYKKEFASMAKNNRNIEIIHVLPCPENKPSSDCGFIDKEKILRHVPKPKEKLYYACGPPGMMSAMEPLLRSLGIPQERIRIEKWQIPGKGEAKPIS
ncbi:MAG: FAD-binding oxidoreductase [Candidatus Micrarchaeota archaeon]|nr:FAD-binding oxidoreductase [Candidatus Micrarchaeota archaeon]